MSRGAVLGEAIRVRLRLDKQEEYEGAATRLGVSLASYLRQRLEDDDLVIEQIRALRSEVTALQMGRDPSSATGNQDTDLTGLNVELLLILRQMQPQLARKAQAEVQRQGYKIWAAEDEI